MYLATDPHAPRPRKRTRGQPARARRVVDIRMSEGVKTVQTKSQMKTIVVRKPGSVRLTARCSNYCYGNCCCL